MGCWCTKVQINMYGILDEHPPIYMTFFNGDDVETNLIFIPDKDEVGVDGRIKFFSPVSSPYTSPYPSPSPSEK